MAEFLATTDVRRWNENTARGSRITADVYARSLRLFCHLTESEPLSLVQLKEAELHGLLFRFVTAEEARKQAGSSTQRGSAGDPTPSFRAPSAARQEGQVEVARAPWGHPIRSRDRVLPGRPDRRVPSGPNPRQVRCERGSA